MAKNYRPMQVPPGIDIKVSSDHVAVKGKLGTISIPVRVGLSVQVDKGRLTVEAATGTSRVHVGSLRAHIGNAVVGVADGYEKILELRGMGYKAQKTKDGVQVNCGFSHPVDFAAPAGVTIDVRQTPDPDDTSSFMRASTISAVALEISIRRLCTRSSNCSRDLLST